MSIDLGFAVCKLRGGRRVGIVDVPGHERFVHNMVAGAAGFDAVVLVVAADDGVMPQTVEHLDIISLLGISRGMAAITKTDLVPPQRVEEVRIQVRALLAGTPLSGCRLAAISAKTGEGLDRFFEAFTGLVESVPPRDTSGVFRVHVERAFVLRGKGVVVTGIPRSGLVRAGDVLELLPGGGEKKVRGIQVFGRDAKEGRSGECIAMKVAGLDAGEAGRGVVLAAPGHFRPSHFVNLKLRTVAGFQGLPSASMRVRFHVGTSDVVGRLVLPDGGALASGEEAYAQFHGAAPVVVGPGDRFVVRRLTPAATIGGGVVVAPAAARMRRSRPEWLEECRRCDEAFQTPEGAVAFVLEKHGETPAALADLAREAFLAEEAAGRGLERLVARGLAVELSGGRYIDAAAHGRVAVGRERRVRERETLAFRLARLFKESGLKTPRRGELPELLGAGATEVRAALDQLIRSGALVPLDDKVLLHAEVVDEARRALVAHLEEQGEIQSATFKELLGTSRKYAYPLLEHFDRRGVTERRGNSRTLSNSVDK